MGNRVGTDEEAFREFVATRRPRLLRAAYLLTGDAGLAEDLVQTALFKTALRWRRVAGSGDPEPYVRRILYTEHVSAWRRRRVPEVLGAEAPPGLTLRGTTPSGGCCCERRSPGSPPSSARSWYCATTRT